MRVKEKIKFNATDSDGKYEDDLRQKLRTVDNMKITRSIVDGTAVYTDTVSSPR